MMGTIYQIFLNAFMITGFVFVMMLVIEYVNVQSRGIWQKSFTGNKWRQYLIAGILGAIPGCLGAFTMVALFSHRLVSFGALVTAMIATSGDEAFVMFAMFPKQAALLTVLLFMIGILAGYITDKFYVPKGIIGKFSEKDLPLHDEPQCKCFQKDNLCGYLFHPSFYRQALSIIVMLLILGVLTGILAGGAKIWMKTTILLSLGFSFFVVVSVPDHFLKKHIWDHIVKVHIPRIFLWTFGTLLAIHFLMNYIDIHAWLSDNMLMVLFVAILIGIIPESGPHLIFVTLFFQGAIPFSVLLASSISQDGHGSLPLLAESKRGFVAVKLVNIIYALVFGLIGYLIGF
ncbi:arsenic efflux protein [candidate division KSB1 bacterium]|nr:arsenic efflux protein [candidate division KSB1 bacterium]MBL7103504.1 arsenic efflux protein [Bacteroidales bacterium]